MLCFTKISMHSMIALYYTERNFIAQTLAMLCEIIASNEVVVSHILSCAVEQKCQMQIEP